MKVFKFFNLSFGELEFFKLTEGEKVQGLVETVYI